MPDHFTDQLAPMPALAAAAAATTSLRVGALVFDNDYKHPVVLAKELATMDVLSDGRVEIGIGAGWMETDYRAAGIPYDRPGVRIDRLEEAARRHQGRDGRRARSRSQGTHYTITDYDGQPKPAQRPHPPILIGGGGRRVLSIAAREADIVGINGQHDGRVDRPRGDRHDDARGGRRAAGPRPRGGRASASSDIEFNIRAFIVRVTDDRAGAVSQIASFVQVEDEMIAASPFALVGSVDEITETLVRRREQLGFSYVIVGGDDVEPFAPVVARLTGT